jgi:hypothetical protein
MGGVYLFGGRLGTGDSNLRDVTRIELYNVDQDTSGSPRWQFVKTFEYSTQGYACWDPAKSILWVGVSGELDAFERVGATWRIGVVDEGSAPPCAKRMLRKSGAKSTPRPVASECVITETTHRCEPTVKADDVAAIPKP